MGAWVRLFGPPQSLGKSCSHAPGLEDSAAGTYASEIFHEKDRDIVCHVVTSRRLLHPAEPGFPDRPQHAGKIVLFSNLHAHSKLSDDIENAGYELLPSKAFPYAQQHGLDFLEITDHHKATDSDHTLRMEPDEYKTKLFDVAKQYNMDHAGEFIAIPGIEWGNTATGNHVNLIGAKMLPPTGQWL